MNNNRPRFLTLWQIRLPVTGFVSILHRISGVLLFLSLPLLLYLLELSLSGSRGFAQASTILESWPLRVAGLLLLWLLAHHLFAGVRVLLIDIEVGSGLQMARRSAVAVLTLALIVVIAGMML